MADIRMLGRATRNASSLVRGLRTSQVWDLPEPLRSYVVAVPVA